MEQESPSNGLAQLTAEIVSAYVSNNKVVAADLPSLIEQTSNALRQAAATAGQPLKEDLIPAVPIKNSVTPAYIVCLEDGKKFKSLKRHLRTHHDLSPDQYREKWRLPYDYPMVAPNYADKRSDLAKKMGLGRK